MDALIESIVQLLLDQNYIGCLEKCLDVYNIFQSISTLKTLPDNLNVVKSKDWNENER